MSKVWNKFGMNYGHHIVGSTYFASGQPAQVDIDLANMWNSGIRKLRLAGGPATAASPDLAAMKDVAVKALAVGFYVMFGTACGSTGNTLTTWNTYMADVIANVAPWAQTAGVQELFIGNEEELKADGTTLTKSTVRTGVRATCVTIKANGYAGLVCYCSENGATNIADWTGNLGTLDLIYFNVYQYPATFRATIISMITAFGNKCGVSEWGFVDGVTGYTTYESEFDYYIDVLQRQDILKSIPQLNSGYFFCYKDGAFGLPVDTFGVLKSNGDYKDAWLAILGNTTPLRRNKVGSLRTSLLIEGNNTITVPNSATTAFNAAGTYTWMGRAKLNRFNAYNATAFVGNFLAKEVGGVSGFFFRIADGYLVFQESKSNTVVASIHPIQWNLIGPWFDWAVTYDGTGHIVKMYINGNYIPANMSLNWTNVISSAGTMYLCGSNTLWSMKGAICDFVMVDRILTSLEIQDFYRGKIPATPKVYLPLAGVNSVTNSAADSSGNSNNGTISSNLMWCSEYPITRG